ncbi:MAG: stage II sporulation protein P [Bacillota bacterium]
MNYYVRYLIYRNRYRMARLYRSVFVVCAVFLAASLLLHLPLAGVFHGIKSRGGFSLFSIAAGWGEMDPRGLVRSAVPVMAWAGNEEDYPEEITPGSLVSAILAPLNIKLASPPDLLASEMPALAEYRGTAATPVVSNVENQSSAAGEMTENALVGIYYTHTGETYSISDGVERKTGEKGGVVEAGEALKEILETRFGIRVAHYDAVNDKAYNSSYVESEKTARQLLGENKDVQVLLDIHRDAGKTRSESLVSINGEEVAPILLIVGSDARSPFPTWRNNRDFAMELSNRINSKYPGLCVGVRVKEGRYNQFLHPRAVLVEIGTSNNTREEAVKSARLLAAVLADIIREIAPDKVKRTAGGGVNSPGEVEIKGQGE